MVEKLIILTFFVLVILSCAVPEAPKGPSRQLIAVFTKKLEDRIIWVESRGSDNIRSKKGALGRYQITPIVVKDYNKWHKKKISYLDMIYPDKARPVYLWLMKTNYRQSKKFYSSETGRKIFTINSYNMGATNTVNGNFNADYCMKVSPGAWKQFSVGRRFKKHKSKRGVLCLI